MMTLTSEDAQNSRVVGHVLANTVEQATKHHAAAVADEAIRRTEYDVRTAELDKLDAGLSEIAGKRSAITAAQSPQSVEATIMAGVMGSPEDRVLNAGIEAALAAQQTYLTRVQKHGHQIIRPLRTLAQLRSLAEYLDAVAVVATSTSFIHARAVYDAGQGVRQLEGNAPLFLIGTVSFQLLEKARKAWGDSNSAWVGFYNQERQINKDSNR